MSQTKKVDQTMNETMNLKTEAVATTATISDDDYDEWENISSDSGNTDNLNFNNCDDENKEDFVHADNDNTVTKTDDDEKKQQGDEEQSFQEFSIIHRSESTPLFSSSFCSSDKPSDEEFSYVLDCDSSVDARSIMSSNNDTVLLSHDTTSTSSMKKVPSFKDIVATNAKKLEEEIKNGILRQKELEIKRREDAIQRRKLVKTRIIVSPIKRCARSTGDLRSLVIHEDEEGHSGGFGGAGSGGGGFSSTVIHEVDEVLGETDAMEYYNRKSHGSKGRAIGQKIRPDEAKRKEMIIHKKNAQRRSQGVREKN